MDRLVLETRPTCTHLNSGSSNVTLRFTVAHWKVNFWLHCMQCQQYTAIWIFLRLVRDSPLHVQLNLQGNNTYSAEVLTALTATSQLDLVVSNLSVKGTNKWLFVLRLGKIVVTFLFIALWLVNAAGCSWGCAPEAYLLLLLDSPVLE